MLLAEIVFVSRILGLAAGEQHVAVQVDAEVRKVEVRRNGERVAVLQQPPWRTIVDLGPERGEGRIGSTRESCRTTRESYRNHS